jgi:hypothetical protein
MLRRTGIVLLAAVSALIGVVPVTASADPYCGITWGSAEKSVNPTQTGNVTNIRAGEHTCYDRLVFDVTGPVDGYWVSYVDRITEDPSGFPIAVRGGARLAVTIQAPSYDHNGNLTYNPANRRELVNTTGYQTFRQAVWSGSWEGTTSIGLGVRARLPFRVFTLPGRVVVDVAHFW